MRTTNITLNTCCDECGYERDIEATCWQGGGDMDVEPEGEWTKCEECGHQMTGREQDDMLLRLYDWAREIIHV